jgi:hypothetical protein
MRTIIYEIHHTTYYGDVYTFKVVHDRAQMLCFKSVVSTSNWINPFVDHDKIREGHWGTKQEAYREMMLEYFYFFGAMFRGQDFL